METTTMPTRSRLHWKPVGLALGSFLALSYLLCVIWDLLIPGQAMYQSWMQLLPGFTWLSWGSFFLGLAESFLYGIYVGVVFVPLYNFFSARSADGTG